MGFSDEDGVWTACGACVNRNAGTSTLPLQWLDWKANILHSPQSHLLIKLLILVAVADSESGMAVEPVRQLLGLPYP